MPAEQGPTFFIPTLVLKADFQRPVPTLLDM